MPLGRGGPTDLQSEVSLSFTAPESLQVKHITAAVNDATPTSPSYR